eukprot:scaffold263_cov251-Pinguiococcus_pyrenoidosus.AAC.12
MRLQADLPPDPPPKGKSKAVDEMRRRAARAFAALQMGTYFYTCVQVASIVHESLPVGIDHKRVRSGEARKGK